MKVAKIEKQILKHLYAATDAHKKLYDAGEGDPTLSLHIAEAIIVVKEMKGRRKFTKKEKKAAKKDQDVKIVSDPVVAKGMDAVPEWGQDVKADD